MKKPSNVCDQSERARGIADFIEGFEHPYIEEFVCRVPEGGKVLDLGCGHGKHVDYFVKEGLEAEGIDLAKGMLVERKRRQKKGKYYEQDFRKLPRRKFESNDYDGLWANAVLKFYTKDKMKELIKEWTRVLKSKGIFYTSFKIKKGSKDYDWLQED